ncbi:hypothetical protein Tcan_03040 [Toxocara canis]|uniref:ShKT domain-containing protein n=1 Tax=Toxocara canis TaxID=6265 RepID=A0A0B2VS21_TOXCA|nr:hypothetical protein Tcan_03040 [Toxocara canis]
MDTIKNCDSIWKNKNFTISENCYHGDLAPYAMKCASQCNLCCEIARSSLNATTANVTADDDA